MTNENKDYEFGKPEYEFPFFFPLTIMRDGDCQLDCSLGNERIRFGHQLSNENKYCIRAYFNWDWARDWLKTLPEVANNNHGRFQPQKELTNMRLIDVSQACVVRLSPVPEYVALSYVWGLDSGGQFRCSKSNIEDLEKPGELGKINLPATITDAILVCKQLGRRFLWVDRLCIIQDDELDLQGQLEQMAAIYHQATFTIVAATGDGATHGLAGVSRERNSGQNVLKFEDGFEIVEKIPKLGDCLKGSKWQKRGWTYQEYLASRRLLFFTDSGLFLKTGIGRGSKVWGEGGVERGKFHFDDPGLRMIESFTKRELTCSTDVLRAISGILQAVYADRTSFGMPWDEFDNALLWMPTSFDNKPRISTATDIFPTWSWASVNGRVLFWGCYDGLFSLAYWGRVVAGGKTTLGPLVWSPLRPKAYSSCMDGDASTTAALAWMHGCLRSDLPKILVADCSKEEYGERLEQRWSNSPFQYWNDVFGGYESTQVFGHIKPNSINHDGCLLGYTQKSSFMLDWRGQYRIGLGFHQASDPFPKESHPVIVRTMDNGIAGLIILDECAAHKFQKSNQKHAEFIALSTGTSGFEDIQWFMRQYITETFRHLTVCEFYGCPCSLLGEEATEKTHIMECPRHVDFRSLEPFDAIAWHLEAGNVPKEVQDNHTQAYFNLLRRLSYYDINGELLHNQESVPFLWAMLVIPSPDNGAERKVYQRLGLARIYLKRWVESSPSFEPIVLE
jgi:hypothetical protein